jgi:hypothetical protein
MTVQTIPLGPPVAGRQIEEFSVTLENIVWQMRLRWSYTAEAWRLDMASTETGTELKGLTLAPGHNLLAPHAVLELGQLWVVDTEGKLANPDFEGIGDRFKLLYVPLSDVDAFTL